MSSDDVLKNCDKKMKKALNKLKPHLMGESVDAMTIIVEGEKKKRDKSLCGSKKMLDKISGN